MTGAGRARLVVLASGGGSNLQAVLDACVAGVLDADVVAVVSDRADAGALDRAHRSGVPAVHVGRAPDEARHAYDERLAAVVAGFVPDLVVLAGFMRLLGMAFLGCFPDAVVNLHPAAPGDLPGVRAIERAYDEARRGERTSTGVMVHFVPDEGVDDGPVIVWEPVEIDPNEPFDVFAERVHAVEHRLIVDAIGDVLRQGRSSR
jgi:phosphoribosylglycinamide formyltransferase 1